MTALAVREFATARRRLADILRKPRRMVLWALVAGVLLAVAASSGSRDGGASAVHDRLPAWAPHVLAAAALAALALAATLAGRMPVAVASGTADLTWYRLAGIARVDAARWTYLRAIVALTARLAVAVVPLALCFAIADPPVAQRIGGFTALVLWVGAVVAAVPVAAEDRASGIAFTAGAWMLAALSAFAGDAGIAARLVSEEPGPWLVAVAAFGVEVWLGWRLRGLPEAASAERPRRVDRRGVAIAAAAPKVPEGMLAAWWLVRRRSRHAWRGTALTVAASGAAGALFPTLLSRADLDAVWLAGFGAAIGAVAAAAMPPDRPSAAEMQGVWWRLGLGVSFGSTVGYIAARATRDTALLAPACAAAALRLGSPAAAFAAFAVVGTIEPALYACAVAVDAALAERTDIGTIGAPLRLAAVVTAASAIAFAAWAASAARTGGFGVVAAAVAVAVLILAGTARFSAARLATG